MYTIPSTSYNIVYLPLLYSFRLDFQELVKIYYKTITSQPGLPALDPKKTTYSCPALDSFLALEPNRK